MNSKEIIRRVLDHDNPPRFGFDFSRSEYNDLKFVSARRYINLPDNPYNKWGDYPELKELTGFSGEVRRDIYGNIYGRFNGKTKGECIRGCIQDWDDYTFILPDFDPHYREELLKQNYKENDKFVIAWGNSLFSTLRDARLISNALMDTITEPDAVYDFIDMLAEHE